MISINLSNIKNCMTHLLLKDTFYDFLFIEGEIVTFNTFQLDGFIQKNFFDQEPEVLPEYSHWKDLQEFCYSIIKGKRTPLSFRFIFSMSPANIQKIIASSSLNVNPNEVQGLYLNLKFDGNLLHCITGTSFKSFSLDKSLEKVWDAYVLNFLEQHSISFETNE